LNFEITITPSTAATRELFHFTTKGTDTQGGDPRDRRNLRRRTRKLAAIGPCRLHVWADDGADDVNKSVG
jgi:hypothetical protein